MIKKKVNKKKIVGVCPVGMHKTGCPSIRRTRQIRVKLIALQREKNLDTDQITKLRSALKERKRKGIAEDCEKCNYNTSANAPAPVSQ